MARDTTEADARFANRSEYGFVPCSMKRITGSLVVCATAGLFTAGALLLAPGESAPSAPAPVAAPPASGSSTALEIKNFKFSPVTVKPGATITIANRDDAAHTVTADKGAFNVKANAKATSSLKAPAKPGTYAFFCAIHPEMKGTLTVK